MRNCRYCTNYKNCNHTHKQVCPLGWETWTGGNRPVPYNSIVEVILETKGKLRNTAGDLLWNNDHDAVIPIRLYRVYKEDTDIDTISILRPEEIPI